jgi:Na+-driven multidrug efflux pump
VSGLVFALDGILIGAGDQRFLAVAMALAFAVFVPFAIAVDATDAGIGWLWASLLLFMAARGWGLWHRFGTNRWAVIGAVRA